MSTTDNPTTDTTAKMFENLDWEHLRPLIETRGLRILIILLVSIIGYRLVKVVVHRLVKSVEDDDPSRRSEAEKRAETLGRVVRQIALVLIGVTAVLSILRELGFEIAPLLAGAGIAGVAVGFGAQNLVRDIITGFFIIFENQIRVGDVVEVAGKTGKVEQVSLRTTLLRDGEGRVHVIPNGQITTVTNMTREWSRVLLDVNVTYKEDLNRVIEVLQAVGQELARDPVWKQHILEPMAILGVNALGPQSVEVRVAVKTAPGSQFDLAPELRRRIKDSFKAAGIRIPPPQTTVVMSQTVDDESPVPVSGK
jgi:moderate conductance mechanosensitive channel